MNNQQVPFFAVCFCLWSVCKIFHIQLWRLFFKLIFRNFCVVVVRIHHKFIWSMRNSNQEWVLSSLRDQNLISTPCLPYKQLVVTSSTGPIFVFPWIHPFGCDDPSFPGRVYSRHDSFSILSLFVAIGNSEMLGRHYPKELLLWFHWGQLVVLSLYQVALIYRDGIHILHTCLRLLRKDWADLQKQLCEK